MFYSGISVGSVQDFRPSGPGNIIEYNQVHDIGQGMLQRSGRDLHVQLPGTRIGYNRMHDVVRRDYGGWGIYPDEGSHDLLSPEEPRLPMPGRSSLAHHNRNITAENNIFALNGASRVDRGGIGGFEDLPAKPHLLPGGESHRGLWWRATGHNECTLDRNLYWNASDKPVLFGSKSFAEWQRAGQDRDSLLADPLFVDPEKGDFRLRAGSPAAKSASSRGTSRRSALAAGSMAPKSDSEVQRRVHESHAVK